MADGPMVSNNPPATHGVWAQVVSDLICKRRLQSCSNSAILIKGCQVTKWTPTADKEQQLSCLVSGT